ncbi:MAG: sugar phosphate isomerase/epimerase [Anaerolineae bacterium]|nr:sugar phosphate isomerase/epimerase [Anaerolineae bacterium]
MKLGVFTATLQNLPLEEALDVVQALGVESVDFSTGGCGTKAHCDPEALLTDPSRLDRFREEVLGRGLEISALCFYGNPLHPDRDVALAHRRELRNTILLAERLGIERIVTLSGCPGDPTEPGYPNWVTYPWPPELVELRRWQWEGALIPFWAAEAAYAVEHGVRNICLELHAVNAVYNPETLLELRRWVGDAITACVNPGHLFWQGIDPVHALRALTGAVGYVHVTDCRIDPVNAPTNGLVDAKEFRHELERSWQFRTIGYGHGEETWRHILLALRLAGYDDVISVEHEDTMLLPVDGLTRSLEFLRGIIVREPLMVLEPHPA